MSFKEFPPRAKAASFTIDQAVEKLLPKRLIVEELDQAHESKPSSVGRGAETSRPMNQESPRQRVPLAVANARLLFCARISGRLLKNRRRRLVTDNSARPNRDAGCGIS